MTLVITTRAEKIIAIECTDRKYPIDPYHIALFTEKHWLRTPNCGPKITAVIKAWLASQGYEMGNPGFQNRASCSHWGMVETAYQQMAKSRPERASA